MEVISTLVSWHWFLGFLAALVLGTGVAFSGTRAKWPALALSGVIVAVLLIAKLS